MRILLMVILALACGLASTLTDARVVHRERSLYNTILVDQRGSLLCLKFSIRRNQRCRPARSGDVGETDGR